MGTYGMEIAAQKTQQGSLLSLMLAFSGRITNVRHFGSSSFHMLMISLYPDEIGTWRAIRYRFGKSYIKAYQKQFPISMPEEDHDDRDALYSMRVASEDFHLFN